MRKTGIAATCFAVVVAGTIALGSDIVGKWVCFESSSSFDVGHNARYEFFSNGTYIAWMSGKNTNRVHGTYLLVTNTLTMDTPGRSSRTFTVEWETNDVLKLSNENILFWMKCKREAQNQAPEDTARKLADPHH